MLSQPKQRFGFFVLACVVGFMIGSGVSGFFPISSAVPGQEGTPATPPIMIIDEGVDWSQVTPLGPTEVYEYALTREAARGSSAKSEVLPTVTSPIPIPLTEQGAISLAMQVLPPSKGPHSPIARKITVSTLTDTLGWGPDLPPDEHVWVAAVRASNLMTDELGRSAGFDPNGLMVPKPSLGIVVAYSMTGQSLGMANLVSEDSTIGQRYSVIEALAR